MIIIWRGFGVLAPIIPVLAWIVIPELFKAALGQEWYSESYASLSALSILTGAVAVWIWGRRLNTKKVSTPVDENTDEQAVASPNHSLFFIKMEYWSVPFGVLALYMLFSQTLT